jgi:hypothetical protein
MEAGKQIFTALSGASCPWTIKTIGAFIRPAGDRAPSGGPGIYGPPARLVTAVNFFNELYDGIPHRDSAVFRRFADKQAHFLSFLAAENGSLLVIEPGVPRSGEFISALRDSLLQRGRRPAAPCPHAGTCPCPGGRAAHKTRWCHFAFDTDGAAPALVKLSAAAGIPKERATLSFIYTGPAGDGNTVNPGSGRGAVLVRIISDPFPVNTGGPGGKPGAVFGRYGCSERGLILVRGGRELVEDYEPGMLAELVFQGTERRDTKSGALVLVPPGTVRIQNLKR